MILLPTFCFLEEDGCLDWVMQAIWRDNVTTSTVDLWSWTAIVKILKSIQQKFR